MAFQPFKNIFVSNMSFMTEIQKRNFCERKNKKFEVDNSFLEWEYFKWIIASLILLFLWIIITQRSMMTINVDRIGHGKKNSFRKRLIDSCSKFSYNIIVKKKWHLHFIKLQSSIFNIISMTNEHNSVYVLRFCSLNNKLFNV